MCASATISMARKAVATIPAMFQSVFGLLALVVVVEVWWASSHEYESIWHTRRNRGGGAITRPGFTSIVTLCVLANAPTLKFSGPAISASLCEASATVVCNPGAHRAHGWAGDESHCTLA